MILDITRLLASYLPPIVKVELLQDSFIEIGSDNFVEVLTHLILHFNIMVRSIVEGLDKTLGVIVILKILRIANIDVDASEILQKRSAMSLPHFLRTEPSIS